MRTPVTDVARIEPVQARVHDEPHERIAAALDELHAWNARHASDTACRPLVNEIAKVVRAFARASRRAYVPKFRRMWAATPVGLVETCLNCERRTR